MAGTFGPVAVQALVVVEAVSVVDFQALAEG